jgi:hypothetical protein
MNDPKPAVKLVIASGLILIAMAAGGILMGWYVIRSPNPSITLPVRTPVLNVAPVTTNIAIPAPNRIDPASPPGNDPGFVMYWQAAAACRVDSPSASDRIFPITSYSPSNPEWLKMEEAAWNSDGLARQLARKARSLTSVTWPNDPNDLYLNVFRNLANHLADAALYADSKGDHVEAVETIRDILHMSDLLEEKPAQQYIRWLVAQGIRALAMSRFADIITGDILTNDPADPKRLQTKSAREVIAQLLDQRPAREVMIEINKAETGAAVLPVNDQGKRWLETANRCNSEMSLMAMSLACHLYLLENHRWPDSLGDLLPGNLPHTVVDPWGDGTQTLAYVLVKGGLPDGSDRPLVYSRCNSSDGLFYIVNQPLYSFYSSDGSKKFIRYQKHGGQFRDVTRWQPAANYTGPTTRPLP